MDVDADDTTAVEPGVVRWVASQSPNPALQALMREAERERKTRPSTPTNEPTSWSYPRASTSSSSPPLSAPATSSLPSSGDAFYPPPLSGSSSSSSLAPAAPEPSISRRAKPLFVTQRKPLVTSISPANQPLRDSARPRSSSHSTATSHPSVSKPKYVSQEEEPEATAFIELLKDVSRQLDKNSEKKQRLAARTKDREREPSLARSCIDMRRGLNTNKSSARPLIKTSSASAICPAGPSTRTRETTTRMSVLAFEPESRGRTLEKTASLGASDVSGKSTPASLQRVNLNCDLKLAPTRTSNTPNVHSTVAPKARALGPPSDDGDSVMQDVIDLTETDMEWEKSIPTSMSRTDTATYMQVDDDDTYNDVAMDLSFVEPESPPRTCITAPKPKSHTASRLPAPTHRTRTGPPPLGMRRTPQLQLSQYGSSQGPKGVSVPRFKPPLLPNARGPMNKSGSEKKCATTISSRPPPRRGAVKVAEAEAAARGNQDADSSFDISFDVDADALEEAMKAYD